MQWPKIDVASEAGHISVLSFFALLGVWVWLKTGDKWVGEAFIGALLYSMRGGKPAPVNNEKEEK